MMNQPLAAHLQKLPLFLARLQASEPSGMCRTISKKTQKHLADANSVAEETLSTMTNVLAHAAQDSSKAAYGALLRSFYHAQAGRYG